MDAFGALDDISFFVEENNEAEIIDEKRKIRQKSKYRQVLRMQKITLFYSQEDENEVCNREKIASRQKIIRRVATTDKSRSYEKCLWMCIITRSQSAAWTEIRPYASWAYRTIRSRSRMWRIWPPVRESMQVRIGRRSWMSGQDREMKDGSVWS